MRHACPWLMCVMLMVGPAPLAGQDRAPRADLARRLSEAAGGPVSLAHSPVTGGVTFLSVPPGGGILVPAEVGGQAATRARWFLGLHGEAFFIRDAAQLRVTKTGARDQAGLEHVRFQQLHGGVPVTAAELVVHLRGDRVTSVSGQTLDGLEAVGVEPVLDAARARDVVRAVLARHALSHAVLGQPRLEVFNRGLLEKRPYPTRLAWFVEAAAPGRREFAWVDAQRGGVLLHFSRQERVLDRAVHTAGGTNAQPGLLVRMEGEPPTGNLDADRAYDYMGSAYDYYLDRHGRDSFDGGGGLLTATVDFCPDAESCPYENAFWDGLQLVFGAGMSRADDVVAHELTHGVVERTANLFYYMQSGALNEAFADIFGQSVDLENGLGDDAVAVRWLLGEDLPAGPMRNMMNPNAFGDPGKLSDPQFVCGRPGDDNGGVHANMGVPSHAFALMVDGGAYNGRTVSGIGLVKAGQIHYRALEQYLGSGSGFQDAYHALRQSCADLVGVAGITPADCAQVATALEAVEMAAPWPCDAPRPAVPALCPAGQGPIDVFFDDLEDGGDNWTGTTLVAPDPWYYDQVFAFDGTGHLWGDDADVIADGRIEMADPVMLPAGARLQFHHAYGFEDVGGTIFFDGGAVEYRVGAGAWSDAGPLFSAGAAYDGIVRSCCGNALGGRQAFAGESFGYTATQLDLSPLAGQSVRFGFRVASDDGIGDWGWFIDGVRIYTCAPSELIFADGFDGFVTP